MWKLFSGKIMWSYSEAAIDLSSNKAITFCFLTTTFRSYFLLKLQVWIIYVEAWHRFDDGMTFTRLHMDFVSTLKRLSVKGDATLQNNKLCQRYFSSIFRTAIMYKKFWRTPISYSTFCITHFKTCFSLILQNVYWKFGILVPGFCNVRFDKAKSENEIFLVIMTIDLIWNTF